MNSLNFRCQDRLISAFFKDVSAVFSDAEIYELKKIISRPFIFPRVRDCFSRESAKIAKKRGACPIHSDLNTCPTYWLCA